MTLATVQWHLNHNMFLNYMIGFFTACIAIWVINKLGKK